MVKPITVVSDLQTTITAQITSIKSRIVKVLPPHGTGPNTPAPHAPLATPIKVASANRHQIAPQPVLKNLLECIYLAQIQKRLFQTLLATPTVKPLTLVKASASVQWSTASISTILASAVTRTQTSHALAAQQALHRDPYPRTPAIRLPKILAKSTA